MIDIYSKVKRHKARFFPRAMPSNGSRGQIVISCTDPATNALSIYIFNRQRLGLLCCTISVCSCFPQYAFQRRFLTSLHVVQNNVRQFQQKVCEQHKCNQEEKRQIQHVGRSEQIGWNVEITKANSQHRNIGEPHCVRERVRRVGPVFAPRSSYTRNQNDP